MKTLVLFGRSPFINEIRDEIPLLCEKFYSMGCNYFVDSFPCVASAIWFDDILPKFGPEHLVVTKKENGYRLKNHEKKELYEVENWTEGFSKTPGKLNFYFHTPNMALNWAYQKGFERVLLAGVDLEIGTPHFDTGDTPQWNPDGMEKARTQFEELCAGSLEVLQLNPRSTLNIRKLSVEDALSGNL